MTDEQSTESESAAADEAADRLAEAEAGPEEDGFEEATTDVHPAPKPEDIAARPEASAEAESPKSDDDSSDSDDGESEEAAAPSEPGRATEPPPSADRSRLIAMRVGRFALAPLLAYGAVEAHYALNVPEHPVVVAPAKKGPKGRAQKRRAPERNPQQMQVSWDRWSVQPYEGEPIKGKWGRQTQSLVSKSVVLARKFAFEGAPEAPRVISMDNQCRTIRCQFTLRSPYRHEIDLVTRTLEHVEANGIPMFRSLEAETIEPPSDRVPRDDHYVRVTVGINVDGVIASELAIDPDYDPVPAPAEDEPEEKAPTDDPAPAGADDVELAPAEAGTPKPAGSVKPR